MTLFRIVEFRRDILYINMLVLRGIKVLDSKSYLTGIPFNIDKKNLSRRYNIGEFKQDLKYYICW